VIAVPLVLLALGQAAMVSGSTVIEFGTPNLALHSAVSHQTVSRVLRILRDEPDPLVDLVSERRMARADRYQLRIPDKYADSVRWRRAGRVEAALAPQLGGVIVVPWERDDGELSSAPPSSARPTTFTPWPSRSWCWRPGPGPVACVRLRAQGFLQPPGRPAGPPLLAPLTHARPREDLDPHPGHGDRAVTLPGAPARDRCRPGRAGRGARRAAGSGLASSPGSRLRGGRRTRRPGPHRRPAIR